jgi:hypothetical protein
MPSPFPGMNPYLEHPGVWEDFHRTFLVTLRGALVRQVVPNYFARIVERKYLLDRGECDTPAHVVLATPGQPKSSVRSTGPVQVSVPRLPTLKVIHLEVMQDRRREPVTIIKLLHPSWKSLDQNHADYSTERRAVMASASNFVEIDLLRGGEQMPWGTVQPAHDYSVAVSPHWERPQVEFWPIQLRDPLPTVPIPLNRDDAPAVIDLQAVLQRLYDSAGYELYIYRRPPDPPLPPPDDAWAADVARAATPA